MKLSASTRSTIGDDLDNTTAVKLQSVALSAVASRLAVLTPAAEGADNATNEHARVAWTIIRCPSPIFMFHSTHASG